jgi:hypothetical protein
MKKIEKATGESFCPNPRLHRIPQGHLLKGEDQVGACLDRNRTCGDTGIVALL